MSWIKRDESTGIGGAPFGVGLGLDELGEVGFKQFTELLREACSFAQQPFIERRARAPQILEDLATAERCQIATR
jgi:hypothetical protein